jgi:2,4-dichlorophenol 6-monooxygenase
MEVMRAAGLEEACLAQAAPQELMANHVMVTSLSGHEFGRMWTWGNDPARAGEYATSSPCRGCDLPQHRFEPVLVGEAARLGARIRFRTKLTGLDQDEQGVLARVLDLDTGAEHEIRARYLVGADGGQSTVASAVDLPLTGTPGVANAMNVRFTADLSRHVAHRPGSLYWVLQPDRVDGMGNAMLRMVRPWDDWVVGFIHLGARNATLTPVQAHEEIRQLIQDDSVEVTVTGISPWRINDVVAERYSAGRVFCAGDAVHRHPPMNGLGGNTCVQDGFNLAWKLAYVVQGLAGPGLLDSYTAERQPIGAQVVDRAIRSWRQERERLVGLGVDPSASPAERQRQFDELSAPTDDGEARRAAFAKTLESKVYSYHAHGVEMNHVYRSGAVVPGGEPPFEFDRDPELFHQPTSHPGARLPHCWVGRDGRTVSTLDLVGPERFTLLTRVRGQEWVTAAREVADELGLELDALRIGPGGEITDLYGDFARTSEIGESGCLLVRPDQHVAWRSHGSVAAAAEVLADVLRTVLDR